MLPSDNPEMESKPITLTDNELFTKIWSEPRVVFKYINDNCYDKYTTVLLILASVVGGLDQASTKSMGDKMSLPAVLAISILTGGFFGWMTYYIYAAMMSWTGKWLKGTADTTSLLRILAYAMFPTILSLIIIFVQIALFGNGIFQSDLDLEGRNVITQGFYYFSPLLELTLGIWTLCLLLLVFLRFKSFL